MTDTLFTASLALARVLGRVRSYKASGTGSTTTLVDTVRLALHGDDTLNGGTIWITEDSDGTTTTAPASEFGIISDFVQSTGTITMSALTAATATGDKYAVAEAMYPLDLLTESINTVLSRVNKVVRDTTSLDTAANTTEYTLPTAVPSGALRKVQFQTQVATDDNRWVTIPNWEIYKSAISTGDELVLPQLTASRDIAIEYVVPHGAIYDAADKIDESISMKGLVYHAAVECLMDRMERESASKYLTGRWNHFRDMAERTPVSLLKIKKPIKGNYVSDQRESTYTGTVGSVRL
jgi:hypothetical protein